MSINLAAVHSELLPGLFDVRGYYEEIEKQWDKIVKVHKSNMATEASTQMKYTGLPELKTEGGATHFDNSAGERFKWTFNHFEVGLGYAITRPAIADNLYKQQFNPTNLGLAMVFNQFKEIQVAGLFNTCTTAITGLGGDGVALASVSHPYDFGTWANTSSTAKSLNETSLLANMTNVRGFVNEAGLKIMGRARKLFIPPQLEGTAIRLTKTELRPGTANNDVNAILSLSGGLPGGYMVMDFLTSAFSWFLATNFDGLILMQREPFETDMWVDNVTDNLLVKAYERYSVGYNDPRAVWCETPTS